MKVKGKALLFLGIFLGIVIFPGIMGQSETIEEKGEITIEEKKEY